MTKPFAYGFDGRVEVLDYGRMVYFIVRLPKALEGRRPFAERKKIRMVGRIGSEDVALAWLVDAKGHYCLVSKALAAAAKIGVGSKVRVVFDVVGDDVLDVPAEIREALRQEPDFREPWKALTRGKQRGLCHLVTKLKSEDARALKAIAILRAVADGNVPGPPRRRR